MKNTNLFDKYYIELKVLFLQHKNLLDNDYMIESYDDFYDDICNVLRRYDEFKIENKSLLSIVC